MHLQNGLVGIAIGIAVFSHLAASQLARTQFETSDEACRQYFGITAWNRGAIRDNDVICSTEFSQRFPEEGGEVHVSLTQGRLGLDQPSAELIEFQSARFLRFTFLKLHLSPSDQMLLEDGNLPEESAQQYFYTIREISIVGQCLCHGHASACEPDPRFTFASVGMIPAVPPARLVVHCSMTNRGARVPRMPLTRVRSVNAMDTPTNAYLNPAVVPGCVLTVGPIRQGRSVIDVKMVFSDLPEFPKMILGPVAPATVTVWGRRALALRTLLKWGRASNLVSASVAVDFRDCGVTNAPLDSGIFLVASLVHVMLPEASMEVVKEAAVAR
ncbi:unnamed protein product [Cyprideis torosa]|uniref:Uncharacterized protein n=1 Tax=Cyprideis torosa TaxID=163714 RepID=A0A7R8W463_9CRUS|nr:unnamed protein product [Cyprideis torosa]CAG0883838.1 unnamed protein product [Cyprideis torosa]